MNPAHPPTTHMRQLVCASYAMFPNSGRILTYISEVGRQAVVIAVADGRVSRDFRNFSVWTNTYTIDMYFSMLLGEGIASPDWSMQHGWDAIIADWFSIILGKPITCFDVRMCVIQTGDHWKADFIKLEAMGLYTRNWSPSMTLTDVAKCVAPASTPGLFPLAVRRPMRLPVQTCVKLERGA